MFNFESKFWIKFKAQLSHWLWMINILQGIYSMLSNIQFFFLFKTLWSLARQTALCLDEAQRLRFFFHWKESYPCKKKKKRKEKKNVISIYRFASEVEHHESSFCSIDHWNDGEGCSMNRGGLNSTASFSIDMFVTCTVPLTNVLT